MANYLILRFGQITNETITALKLSFRYGANAVTVTTDMRSRNQAACRNFGIVVRKHFKTVNSLLHPADIPHLYKNTEAGTNNKKTLELPRNLQEDLRTGIVGIKYITNLASIRMTWICNLPGN